MIEPARLFQILKDQGIAFFAGVPDSLLKSLCAYLDDHAGPGEHVITANEGNAVALAAGYHLATGRIGAVYMQNSGLGNCVNPLTSLADPQVYSIPMLLIIGWRGEPGVKDEPQHVKQGRITPGQLELLEIPYRIMDDKSDPEALLFELVRTAKDENRPVALVVRKKTLADYRRSRTCPSLSSMGREKALGHILDLAGPEDIFISTTGKTSRELYELRTSRSEPQKDFLTVGSMGHTSSIALGVALGRPDRRVICLDGDGSLLMHMGNLPVIGQLKPANLVHVVLNNAAHESVGGQETVCTGIDLQAVAMACGYRACYRAENDVQLSSCWEQIREQKGPFLLELRICTGSRPDLGRPASTPVQNKKSFMDFCRE